MDGKALLSVGVDAILAHQPQPLNKTKVRFIESEMCCGVGSMSARWSDMNLAYFLDAYIQPIISHALYAILQLQ